MDLWVRRHIQPNVELSKATHFYSPTRSHFAIPIDAQSDFWLTYCQAVHEGKNPGIFEYVRNQETVQLGFNLKLMFPKQQVPDDENLMEDLKNSIDSYVEHIIGTIQNIMERYFILSQKKSELLACHLRRPDDNFLIQTKDAVEYQGKIIFPYTHIRPDHMNRFHHVIINQLQLQSGDEDILVVSPSNGLETTIVPFSNEIVEMYGSAPESSLPLTHYVIYGYLNNDNNTTYSIEGVFPPGMHMVVRSEILPMNEIQEKSDMYGLKFWLPLFFSNGYYNTNPIEPADNFMSRDAEVPQITVNVVRENNETLGQLERARRLLNLLSISRVDEYWSWIDIGEALHTIDCEEGLNLWKWFTEQSDFKDEQDCEEVWYTFDDASKVDIRTLEYFASVDNSEGYAALREKDVEDAIDKALFMQEHTQIAKAFQACYPHDFICANYDAGQWYHYANHRWTQFSGTSLLMYHINEHFQSRLEKLRAEISNKVVQSRDPEFKARTNSKIDLIGNLIKQLSKNGFKESLCKELKIYYYDPNFNNIRDMNKYYMATPNCVLDFRGGKGVARPGKPQDYITKSTRYPFPKTYNWETPAVKDTLYYLSQVFRSQTLRQYFMRLLSSLMVSGNNDKIFPILAGEGNNSKSILVRLIEAAFGNYAVKLPTSLITEKRTGADSATPTLIHSRGAKVAFLQEPNRRENIQSGTVKEMTGNDTMYVRDLFQKGSAIVEMEVTIVPFLVTNKIPGIEDCQQAIWDRTRVLDFLSKWDAEAPEDVKEQFVQGVFPKDKFFDRKVPGMAPALLWLAFQGYEDYYENGLVDPPEVLQATENFRVANNIFIHFTRDSVKQVLDENGNVDLTAPVELDELFNTFRKWYQDQQYRSKMPTKTEFKEGLEAIWKQKADGENKWYGLKLNNQASTISSILTF